MIQIISRRFTFHVRAVGRRGKAIVGETTRFAGASGVTDTRLERDKSLCVCLLWKAMAKKSCKEHLSNVAIRNRQL